MGPIFKKLNLKEQDPVLVMNSPASFQPYLQEVRDYKTVFTDPKEVVEAGFLILFAENEKIMRESLELVSGRMAEGDILLWVAYPKKSSRNYRSDIHRDSDCWLELGSRGFEAVRQVAIDEDWSALRFRRAAFIKTMNRSKERAISKSGKDRTTRK